MKWIIIKLGGSLVSPYEAGLASIQKGDLPYDFAYAEKFIDLLLSESREYAFVIAVGGGFLNRWMLSELKKKKLGSTKVTTELHTIGIAASIMNANIFKLMLARKVIDPIYPGTLNVDEQTSVPAMVREIRKNRFVVAAGGKPGYSNDVDALLLGYLLGAKTVISLKNVDGVYTADPRKDPTATKLAKVTWQQYLDIIKVTEHTPGANFPVDVIAAHKAMELGKTFIICDGKDFVAIQEAIELENTTRGTVISG